MKINGEEVIIISAKIRLIFQNKNELVSIYKHITAEHPYSLTHVDQVEG